VCYLLAFIDRGNIGMASLQMNHDLGITPQDVRLRQQPVLHRLLLVRSAEQPGAAEVRRAQVDRPHHDHLGPGLGRNALVQGANSLYVLRFLLGAAEAGFFPGVLLYMTYWIPGRLPRALRRHLHGRGADGQLRRLAPVRPAAAADGVLGLRGWHWLFILEGLPTVVMGLVCLFFLTDRPEQAKWLSEEQRNWLSARMEQRTQRKKAAAHVSLWKLFRSKEVLGMALVCATASSAGTVLGVWQPQLIKSFGLTIMQTGLLNSVPYAIAAMLMVWWGRHSDRKGERRWHTVIPLALICRRHAGHPASSSLAPTIVLLTCVLVGAYSFKGPFWALSSGWLSSGSAAAGLAGINAAANLIGGGLMVNVYGWIKAATGSHALALLPIACLALASIVMLLSLSSEARQAARNAAAKAAA
jgi:ACS family tartrate transporter-like MFS transporter